MARVDARTAMPPHPMATLGARWLSPARPQPPIRRYFLAMWPLLARASLGPGLRTASGAENGLGGMLPSSAVVISVARGQTAARPC